VRKIANFVRMPWAIKCFFAEALLISAYVKATLLFLPFSRVAIWLGSNSQLPTEMPNNLQVNIVKQIRIAIKLCDKYAPWPTECYTRSLTAKLMLKRKNLKSTLFFGFSKDDDGQTIGHAWLKCSGILVTGFCDFSKYKVHSSFS
jgi:hypothetical protein